MVEQMMELSAAAHNTSMSGAPRPLLSSLSLAGIVVGSVLLFALSLAVVALGVLVVVLARYKFRAVTRSQIMGSALPNESVKLTRILDLNDTVDEHQDSVSEMPTVTPQPVTSTYETVVGHHETQGNTASEYEEVVSHSLSVHQPVAHGHNQYACVATEAVHGFVYSIVPAQRYRESRDEIEGITLQPDHIYQTIDSAVPQYENIPFLPPARHLANLFDQLAEHSCIEIPRPALSLKKSIGSGEFGKVYRAVWETPYGPEEVAIKVLKTGTSEEDKVKFLQEAAVMAQFRHPHIVRLLGAVTVDEPIMLIMELMHCGDLLAWLSECRKGLEFSPLSSNLPHRLLQFCQEIADGMKYLSNKGFVHRDLAARNILLDKNLSCKITDFGLTRDLTFDPYYVSAGKKIPIRWTAPEALMHKRYATSSDVWSYGMLLFEIWSLGQKPFPALNPKEVVQLLKSKPGFLQPPTPGCPRAVYELMVHCWDHNHHGRPSFSQILDTLSEAPVDSLLTVPEGCLALTADSTRAAQLGGPMMTARDLYKDLQQFYCNSQ